MDLNFRVSDYKEMRSSKNICKNYPANNILISEPFSFFFLVGKNRLKQQWQLSILKILTVVY